MMESFPIETPTATPATSVVLQRTDDVSGRRRANQVAPVHRLTRFYRGNLSASKIIEAKKEAA
jgi:hypothetical protein